MPGVSCFKKKNPSDSRRLCYTAEIQMILYLQRAVDIRQGPHGCMFYILLIYIRKCGLYLLVKDFFWHTVSELLLKSWLCVPGKILV